MKFWKCISLCFLVLLLIKGVEHLKHLIKGPKINVICDDSPLITGYGYTTEDVKVMSTPWYFDYRDPWLIANKNFDLNEINVAAGNNNVLGKLPALTEIEIIENQASGYMRSSAILIKSLDKTNPVKGYIHSSTKILCIVTYNGKTIYDAKKVSQIINRNDYKLKY